MSVPSLEVQGLDSHAHSSRKENLLRLTTPGSPWKDGRRPGGSESLGAEAAACSVHLLSSRHEAGHHAHPHPGFSVGMSERA